MDSWFLIVPPSSLGDRVSLRSSGCAGPQIDQAVFELTDPPATASQGLGFKMLHGYSSYLVISQSCEIWFAFAIFKGKKMGQ